MSFYCAKKDPKQKLRWKSKNKNSELTKSSQMQMKVDALLPPVNPKNQTKFH